MTNIDLSNILLYLYPSCKCSIWATSNPEEYYGEFTPIKINNFLVDWDPAQIPTTPDIQAINTVDMTLVNQNAETIRKQARDQAAKSDLNLVSGYQVAKLSNSSLTFSQYLDQLEAIQL